MASRPASERLAVLQGSGPTTDTLVMMARDGDAVIGESALESGGRLDLEAVSVRRERTGIHATVRLSTPDGRLAYDTFNIERNEERRKLSSQAAKTLGDEKRWAQVIKMRLDEFCDRAWSVFVEGHEPRRARGSDAPASRLLLNPYLADSRTILFAPGGAGKSWTALIWALSLNYGLSNPWQATSGAVPVLWLDFEDTPQAFDSRLAQAAALLGCPAEMLAYHFEGRRLVDVWEPVQRFCQSGQVGFVVVDSISRLGLGKLIDDQTANQTVDLLNRLGVPWLALGHTARGPEGGNHVFGSGHFEFGARVVIKAESATSHADPGLIGMRFEIVKANHMLRGQAQTWAYRFDAGRLVEHRPAAAGDFPELRDTRSPRERIREFLTAVGSAPVEEICEFAEASDRTVRRLLLEGEGSDFERLASGTGRGHKAVWGRMRPVSANEP